MAAGSIWDWLILLIILACPVLTVATETSGNRVSRRKFAIASFFWLPSICASDVLWLFFNLRTDVASIAFFVVRIVLVIWFYRLVVRRVRDADHQKSVAYLACSPVVNIVFFLYLLFPGSKADMPAVKTLEQ
jgi:hypothetical protein